MAALKEDFYTAKNEKGFLLDEVNQKLNLTKNNVYIVPPSSSTFHVTRFWERTGKMFYWTISSTKLSISVCEIGGHFTEPTFDFSVRRPTPGPWPSFHGFASFWVPEIPVTSPTGYSFIKALS